jgi:hypothetical protein
MAFDLAAWAVLFAAASIVGRGALSLLRADDIRFGDRLVLGAWIGIIVIAVALLALSLFSPLTPAVSSIVAAVVVALGAVVPRRAPPEAGAGRSGRAIPRRAIALGLAALAAGSAALASDPVTLYDALVYHVGVIKWLHEAGTVPGVALIHNRLGHVSSWFTLAAAFDAGPAANRAANVPLGFALMLAGVQTALAVARIAGARAVVADWFLAIGSAALIWGVLATNAASPSPDVATNVLILIAAWSVLIVSPDPTSFRRRLVPFVVALGACSMKLFGVPAVLATGCYAVLAAPHEGPGRPYVRRALVCAGLAAIIAGPFLVANVIASGCPAYPSPVGCLDVPWSVGASRAADYATYVRDVARWDIRGETSAGASISWVVSWILKHPVISLLAVLSPILMIRQLRRMAGVDGDGQAPVRVSGVRAVGAFALLGVAFAVWQAPAPRFVYAFVTIVPVLSIALATQSRTTAVRARPATPRRAGLAFVTASVAVGFLYALASQKLNVRSALVNSAPVSATAASELLWPAAPELPARLFRWRVNDIDVLTAVPRPVADTLDYHSSIGVNTSFEKCSTAPLPCTPYLPGVDVRLRRPERGLSGGFVRDQQPDLAGRAPTCVGELDPAASLGLLPLTQLAPVTDHSRCGDDRR